MAKEVGSVVYAVRDLAPVVAYCTGSFPLFSCGFAVETSRALPEVDVRRMARTHATKNPGHVVEVAISDITRYSTGL